MTTTIAVSGKGGTGKTTMAAMIIRSLIEQKDRAVLAVDADPNSCLGLVTGVEPVETVAEIREQARQKKPSNEGMDRVRLFQYGIQHVITEAKGFDLITMGRPEGPDCYCAANNLLRSFLDELSKSYEYVVMDNEAGMEHLSRRTTNYVDLLCVIAEPTRLGVITVRRILELTGQLPISVKQAGVIWNKVRNSQLSILNDQLPDNVETLGAVPYDKAVFDSSMQERTVFDIEQNNPALLAVGKILENKLSKIIT